MWVSFRVMFNGDNHREVTFQTLYTSLKAFVFLIILCAEARPVQNRAGSYQTHTESYLLQSCSKRQIPSPREPSAQSPEPPLSRPSLRLRRLHLCKWEEDSTTSIPLTLTLKARILLLQLRLLP